MLLEARRKGRKDDASADGSPAVLEANNNQDNLFHVSETPLTGIETHTMTARTRIPMMDM